MDTPPDLAAPAPRSPWLRTLTWFVLGAGLVLRLTNLGDLPPFLDETSSLLAARNYEVHPVMERLFLGKYFGYLPQRPIVEFANDPIWAGRVLSALFGLGAAVLAALTVRRLAGERAALTCTVILALGPQLVFHDRLALPESCAVFFVAAGCLAWVLGRERQRPGMFVVAGVAAALACATKIYVAPVFLLILVLASGSAGGVRTFFRRELLPVFLGFAGAGFLLFLSALDHTWANSLSLEDLMRMPKMIVAGSADVPSLGSRLGQAASLIEGYLPVTFWLLLIPIFFSAAAFRKQAIGCLIVALAVFVLYGIFFRTFVATRYFNVIWIPLALGVSLGVASAAGGEEETVSPVRRWVNRAQLLLLALVALQFTRRDAFLLTKPESFPLPHSDYYQYFSGWPSGRGLENVAAFLQNQSIESDKPILVLTLMGFRHGNTSLPMMMRANPLVRFIPVWEGNDFAASHLPAWLHGNMVFAVVEPMGTPTNFQRLESAGFQSALVFSAPDFEGSPGYRIFRVTKKP